LKKEEAEIGTYARSVKKASKSERTTGKRMLASEFFNLSNFSFLLVSANEL